MAAQLEKRTGERREEDSRRDELLITALKKQEATPFANSPTSTTTMGAAPSNGALLPPSPAPNQLREHQAQSLGIGGTAEDKLILANLAVTMKELASSVKEMTTPQPGADSCFPSSRSKKEDTSRTLVICNLQ